jgi:hypothetical protein
MMIEIEGSGVGSRSIPLTNGSGSGRPKNMWIRSRIRIRNTADIYSVFSPSCYPLSLTGYLTASVLDPSVGNLSFVTLYRFGTVYRYGTGEFNYCPSSALFSYIYWVELISCFIFLRR